MTRTPAKQRTERLQAAAADAKAAEARGDNHAANDAWRRYSLIANGGRPRRGPHRGGPRAHARDRSRPAHHARAAMSVQPGPLLAALNNAEIPYVVIGGFAVIANGVVRTTEDLDVLTPATAATGARIAALLAELAATRQDGSALEDFLFDGEHHVRALTRHGLLDVIPEGASPLTNAEIAAAAHTVEIDGTGGARLRPRAPRRAQTPRRPPPATAPTSPTCRPPTKHSPTSSTTAGSSVVDVGPPRACVGGARALALESFV